MAKTKSSIPKDMLEEIIKLSAKSKERPVRNFFISPSILTGKLNPPSKISTQIKANKRLIDLISNPPLLDAIATEDFDGRTVPVIVLLVRNAAGITQPGILTRLVEVSGGSTQLIDQSYTNIKGISLLKYNKSVDPADLAGLSNRLKIEIPGILPVNLPGGQAQQSVAFNNVFNIVREIVVTQLPNLTDPVVQSLIKFTENPLDRLPSDF